MFCDIAAGESESVCAGTGGAPAPGNACADWVGGRLSSLFRRQEAEEAGGGGTLVMGWLWLGRRPGRRKRLFAAGTSSSPPELRFEPCRFLARRSCLRAERSAAASSSDRRRIVACLPSWCIFRLTAACGSVEPVVPVVPVVVVLPPSVAPAPAVGAALAPLLSCDIEAEAVLPWTSGLLAKRVREPCFDEREGLVRPSFRLLAAAPASPAAPTAPAAGATKPLPYALNSFAAVFSATSLPGSGSTAPGGISAEPKFCVEGP